jgi:hypothetical protein
MSFFRPNISMTGRLVRGAVSLALIAGAVLVWNKPDGLWLAIPLGLAGLFVMFEAIRGWCVARACGWKTFV